MVNTITHVTTAIILLHQIYGANKKSSINPNGKHQLTRFQTKKQIA